MPGTEHGHLGHTEYVEAVPTALTTGWGHAGLPCWKPNWRHGLPCWQKPTMYPMSSTALACKCTAACVCDTAYSRCAKPQC